ncbi:unnamed protein product, partial [Scytosiphon promiscuus]
MIRWGAGVPGKKHLLPPAGLFRPTWSRFTGDMDPPGGAAVVVRAAKLEGLSREVQAPLFVEVVYEGGRGTGQTCTAECNQSPTWKDTIAISVDDLGRGHLKVAVCSGHPLGEEELTELAFRGVEPPPPVGYVRVPLSDLAGLERSRPYTLEGTSNTAPGSITLGFTVVEDETGEGTTDRGTSGTRYTEPSGVYSTSGYSVDPPLPAHYSTRSDLSRSEEEESPSANAPGVIDDERGGLSLAVGSSSGSGGDAPWVGERRPSGVGNDGSAAADCDRSSTSGGSLEQGFGSKSSPAAPAAAAADAASSRRYRGRGAEVSRAKRDVCREGGRGAGAAGDGSTSGFLFSDDGGRGGGIDGDLHGSERGQPSHHVAPHQQGTRGAAPEPFGPRATGNDGENLRSLADYPAAADVRRGSTGPLAAAVGTATGSDGDDNDDDDDDDDDDSGAPDSVDLSPEGIAALLQRMASA